MSLRTLVFICSGMAMICPLPAETVFPAGYIPFDSIYYVTGAATSSDRLVVGAMSRNSFDLWTQLPGPITPNEMFADQRVELAPGQFFSRVYVPEYQERFGAFPECPGCVLYDPADGYEFPRNIIPARYIPGLMAIRVGADIPEPLTVEMFGLGLIVCLFGRGANLLRALPSEKSAARSAVH
jgi:hypothetical protein